MTAPVGDDLTWLADLERAHAAATPGPWAQHPSDDEYVIGDVSDDGMSYADVGDTYAFRKREGSADAALIVAAVNAVPTLIAELRKRDATLRAVEALHVPSHSYCVVCDVERDVEVAGNNPRCEHRTSFCRACEIAWPCPTVRALTAALTPESVTT